MWLSHLQYEPHSQGFSSNANSDLTGFNYIESNKCNTVVIFQNLVDTYFKQHANALF